MDKEVIREIASQIVNESILYNWKLYAVAIALFIIFTALRFFISSYFEKRGEQLARKSDLDIIINELKHTTRTTESIKNDIEKETWVEKEFNILRRQKLEELLVLLYKYKERIHKEAKESIIDIKDFVEDTSIDLITAIHKLYFPELDEEMRVFYLSFVEHSTWKKEALQRKVVKIQKGELPYIIGDDNLDLYKSAYTNVVSSIGQVENKARIIMDNLRTV